MITPDESARLDAAAADPVETLMERAGLAVALEAVAMGLGYGSRATVLAGAGNNGGDGYVAARYLRGRGVAVDVRALGPAKDPTGPAGLARRRAVAAGVPIGPLEAPATATDLVIDALFGVGFRGDLPTSVSPWLRHPAPVLAVDVPSGLDAATGQVSSAAFTADRTVTFHALKVGHLVGEGPDRCGPITVADIGLEGGELALRYCEASDAPRPRRGRTSHKWSVGSVAVVGGSPGITGAPMLAAEAALAAGAGAVTLICPGGLQAGYAALTPEVMTSGVGSGTRFRVDDVPEVLTTAGRFDVMILGPGLGADTEGFVNALVEGRRGPLLLDADALNALDDTGVLRRRDEPTLVTPHAGEFRRLVGVAADHGAAARLAEQLGIVVLLKGSPTFVMGRDRWVVTSGGPELATIGSGDVLAGVIGALWARGLDTETAARSGAYWHGRAGATAAGTGTVTPRRLIDAVRRLASG